MAKIEFVSYDGKYPCLCMGTLTIKVDGKVYRFNDAMKSGGCVLRNDNPCGCFWLRTKSILKKDEINESLAQLIDNIKYWFDDMFDNYFSIDK